MRNNILFITSKFLPAADANGICVANVAKELKKMGYNIFCICEREPNASHLEEIDGIKVIRINPTFFLRVKSYYNDKSTSKFRKYIFTLVKILRRFKAIVMLPFFPNVSPVRSRRILNTFKKIHTEYKIDCIIGVFRPYEGINVAVEVKKKFPQITCIAYYLDLLRGIAPPKPMPKGLYEKMSIKSEMFVSKILDKVLIPVGAREMYNNFEFNVSKFQYIDFPLFTLRDIDRKIGVSEFNKEYINIVYAGTMDMKNRNPEYFLRILSKIHEKNIKIKFHIYGSLNDAITVIEKYTDKYPGLINFYGKVDYAKIDIFLENADFLLNISNKTTPKMIPSKIFQLFASKKPIINVVNNMHDSAVSYFEQYPLVLYLKEFEGHYNKDVDNLKDFLINKRGLKVSHEDINEIYKQNKPEFTAKIIESIIKVGKEYEL